MFTRRNSADLRLDANSMDRRRFLTLTTGALAVSALAPVLAACDDDDDAQEDAPADPDTDTDTAAVDDEQLQEAMEEAEEETGGELDALDDSDDEERTFPDDFPENIPVPDDAEIILDMSFSRDDESEIYIAFVSNEDRVEWLDTYDSEIEADYEVDSRHRNDDMDTGQWDFNGHGWEWSRVELSSARDEHDAEFQVLTIFRNYD
jgi:hypothetical protein